MNQQHGNGWGILTLFNYNRRIVFLQEAFLSHFSLPSEKKNIGWKICLAFVEKVISKHHFLLADFYHWRKWETMKKISKYHLIVFLSTQDFNVYKHLRGVWRFTCEFSSLYLTDNSRKIEERLQIFSQRMLSETLLLKIVLLRVKKGEVKTIRARDNNVQEKFMPHCFVLFVVVWLAWY